MKSSSTVLKHKHLVLDQAKIKRAQKALGAKTETETIDRALEIVIAEESSRLGGHRKTNSRRDQG